MSNLTHCDGPGCEVTQDPDAMVRPLCEVGWTHVEQAGREFDFHDTDCLVKWAGGHTKESDLSELVIAWHNPPMTYIDGQRINIHLVREWPALGTAINRLLGT